MRHGWKLTLTNLHLVISDKVHVTPQLIPPARHTMQTKKEQRSFRRRQVSTATPPCKQQEMLAKRMVGLWGNFLSPYTNLQADSGQSMPHRRKTAIVLVSFT
jgi:hypothetical protein